MKANRRLPIAPTVYTLNRDGRGLYIGARCISAPAVAAPLHQPVFGAGVNNTFAPARSPRILPIGPNMRDPYGHKELALRWPRRV